MQQITVKGELKKRPSWLENKNCANTSICWLHLVIMSILIYNRKKMCQYFYLLASFGYHVNTDTQQKHFFTLIVPSSEHSSVGLLFTDEEQKKVGLWRV